MKSLPLLLAIALLPTVALADVVDTFESYATGTPGTAIDNAFATGQFVTGSVQDRGRDGSKGLCAADEGAFSDDGRMLWDLMTPASEIPGVGGSVQLSIDFQIVNSLDLSNPNMSFSNIASVGYSGTFGASQSVFVTVIRSGTNWDEYSLFLQQNLLGGSTNVISGARPISDLGLTSNSPGEFSDYFSLELEVLHTAGSTGFATANLFDQDGNVLETLSLDMPNFVFDFATADLPDAEVSFFDPGDSVSEVCIDNFRHAAFEAIPEPTALGFLLIFGVGLATKRQRRI